MGSISVRDLKEILNDIPDDYEIIMEIHHKYDIPKESGKKGWIAYINSVKQDELFKELRLMN